jgi:Mg2+ and Co2+ transporter CorA
VYHRPLPLSFSISPPTIEDEKKKKKKKKVTTDERISIHHFGCKKINNKEKKKEVVRNQTSIHNFSHIPLSFSLTSHPLSLLDREGCQGEQEQKKKKKSAMQKNKNIWTFRVNLS